MRTKGAKDRHKRARKKGNYKPTSQRKFKLHITIDFRNYQFLRNNTKNKSRYINRIISKYRNQSKELLQGDTK